MKRVPKSRPEFGWHFTTGMRYLDGSPVILGAELPRIPLRGVVHRCDARATQMETGAAVRACNRSPYTSVWSLMSAHARMAAADMEQVEYQWQQVVFTHLIESEYKRQIKKEAQK